MLGATGCSSCGNNSSNAARNSDASASATSATSAKGDAASSSVIASSLDASSSDASRADDLPDDAPFEGTLTLSAGVLDEDAPHENRSPSITLTTKGNDAWWPIDNTGGGVRLYKGDQHTIFTIPTGDLAMYAADVTKITRSANPRTWKLALVSKAGAILKYPCERWRTNDDNYRYEACVAKGLTPFPFHVIGPPWSDVLPYGGELMKQGLFPLSAMRTPLNTPKADASAAGPSMRYEVTKITRARVPVAQTILPDRKNIPRDSLFLPPPLL